LLLMFFIRVLYIQRSSHHSIGVINPYFTRSPVSNIGPIKFNLFRIFEKLVRLAVAIRLTYIF
jgi:hypothetical protein